MSEVWRRIDAEWPDKPYYNMAVEEAIPRMVEAGKVPNTIRFWRNANTIVIGRFQCPTLEIKFSECLKYSVEVIRRFTGGGAVYHDLGNLNYAVSIRRPHPKFSGDLLEAFKTICECVIEGLKILGVNAYFKPINDIEVNGRKISGLAGMITKNLIFIHGCILISSNLSILNRVLNIPKEYLESKRISDVKARVTTLRDELGRDVSVEEVKNAYVAAIKEISLDSPVNPSEEEDSMSWGEIIAQTALPSPEEYYKEIEKKELLEKIFSVLTEREAKIIKLYYGFEDGNRYNLEQIGRIFGISRERVRQLRNKAIEKIKKKFGDTLRRMIEEGLIEL